VVERLWGQLGRATTRAVLDFMIEDKPQLASLTAMDRDALWAAVEARRSGEAAVEAQPTDLRPAEWRVLCDPVIHGRVTTSRCAPPRCRVSTPACSTRWCSPSGCARWWR
jgi:hypothetical protein